MDLPARITYIDTGVKSGSLFEPSQSPDSGQTLNRDER